MVTQTPIPKPNHTLPNNRAIPPIKKFAMSPFPIRLVAANPDKNAKKPSSARPIDQKQKSLMEICLGTPQPAASPRDTLPQK
jgi:hypothetical protein